MDVIKTGFEGLFIIEPKVFGDERGYFMESFNQREFEKNTGAEYDFVQDNESLSKRGILRGLHFQVAPHAQGKLIRVVNGAVLDVCVDLRPDQPTLGQHIKVELTGPNKRMLFVPPGFAHGFVTLQDNTLFQYKCTGYYHPESERTLMWNDTTLGIDWGIADPILSEKDQRGLPLSEVLASEPFKATTANDR
jgi:dTDP-4-dehydrorhamnose 3,5-epimerase